MSSTVFLFGEEFCVYQIFLGGGDITVEVVHALRADQCAYTPLPLVHASQKREARIPIPSLHLPGSQTAERRLLHPRNLALRTA